MKLKDFNNYKVVNLKGQTVKKKTPWPAILTGIAVTVAFILIIWAVKPNFDGAGAFSKQIKNFFDFSDTHIGLQLRTASETLSVALQLLWKTILFSVLGTILGIIISIPLALVSSKAIVKKWYIYTPFRVVMSILRAIPPLIIAFLMYNVFSKTLSASLALSVFVCTMMTKWLYEELDTIDLSSFDALQSAGNQKNRSIIRAVFPYLAKTIISYGVYSFEMVIRFAAILGVVGISTIGILMSDTYATSDKWGHLTIVLAVLIVTIVIIELASMMLKKYVLDHKPKQMTLDKEQSVDYQIAQAQIKPNVMKWIKLSILAIVAILLVLAVMNVEWHIANPIKLRAFKRGMNDLFHPTWKYITEFGTGLNAIETGALALLMALGGVVIGLIFATIFGFLAAKNITGNYFSWIFKILIIIIRSIPAFVYAILFKILAPDMEHKFIFAGVLALGIHSIGMLGKMTYEKIDSIDRESRDALEVMGSTRFLSTRWAILQEVLPTILANALYRVEVNFKSTVELGAIGVSMFGFQIAANSADPTHFADLTPYLIVTIVVVLTLEQISNIVRKRLMTGLWVNKNNFIYKWMRKQSTISAMIYADAYGLTFVNSVEGVKFVNYVGPKMRSSQAHKEAYNNSKVKVHDEIKKSSYQNVVTLRAK